MKKYFRSKSDRMIAGVCGGLAKYMGIDSLLIRIGFIVLLFGYGVGLLAYILLWLLAPEQ